MTSVDYVALGRRIRIKRKTKGLTQEKLAESSKISLSFLGHIERGSRKASIETLLNIAIALKTTIDELLRDSMRGFQSEEQPNTETLHSMFMTFLKNSLSGTSEIEKILYNRANSLSTIILNAFYCGYQCGQSSLQLDAEDEIL